MSLSNPERIVTKQDLKNFYDQIYPYLSNCTSNYAELSNKPSINNVTLSGNKTTADLGISYNDLTNTPDIPTKVSDLTNDTGFITEASIPTNVSDLTNDTGFITSANLPTATSDLTNDSGFITNAVNDLVNYYLKSETYTKTEVDAIATAVKNSRFEVVNTLPTEDIKTNVIYLVPKSSAQSSNAKDEYINLDGTTSGWEKIGDTEVDISGYVTTSALNTALADYVATTDLNTLLADYALSASLATVATSGDYDDLTNKPSIPAAVSDLTNDSGYVVSTDLATVATSGDYDDLTNKPSIPSNVSDLTNDTGFITSADIPTKISDLTDDSDFVESSELATVATSGSYNDLTNKPSIPAAVSDLTNDTGFITSADIPTKISDLTDDSDFVESSELATVATSGSYNDLTNTPSIPAATSDITNDSGFITKAVNDLVNYYLKSETYTKTEVDAIATAVKNSRFEVVNTLPTEDIKTNVIYLVPKSTAGTNNVKDEYINLDGTTSGWEKIGDTEVDISGYVTTSALNTALADYVTSTGLTTILADYVEATDLATVATSGSYNDLSNTPSIPDDLGDLSDVNVASLADGQVLAYDSTTQKWVNSSDAGGHTYTAGDGISISNNYVISADTLQSGDMDDIISPAPAPITEGHDLGDILDVTLTTPTDGQVLTYDATNEVWVNANASGGSVTIDELGDIDDVDLANIQNGQTIVWDATNSKWVAAAPSDASAYHTGDTAFTGVVDNDYIPVYDSSASAAKKTLWSNVKSLLKTYFDTIYSTVTSRGTATNGGTTLSLVNTGDMYTWNNKADKPTFTSKTLSAGSTSVTFTGLPTSGNYAIDFYTSTGINFTAISTSSGSATLTFPSQSAAVTVYCEVKAI